MKNIDSINEVEKSFENFDKWNTYGTAFSAMDNGRILLREIIAIAERFGMTSHVIKMRRLQWNAMKKGPANNYNFRNSVLR